MSIPKHRFLLVTDIAHSPSLLEDFVQKTLLHFDSMSILVTIDGVQRHLPNDPPTVVPEDVVAVLIRQPELPATIAFIPGESGYVVKESASGKPEQFYVLFVNCGEGSSCTIEGTVEVRYFYPRDADARAIFFASYYNSTRDVFGPREMAMDSLATTASEDLAQRAP